MSLATEVAPRRSPPLEVDPSSLPPLERVWRAAGTNAITDFESTIAKLTAHLRHESKNGYLLPDWRNDACQCLRVIADARNRLAWLRSRAAGEDPPPFETIEQGDAALTHAFFALVGSPALSRLIAATERARSKAAADLLKLRERRARLLKEYGRLTSAKDPWTALETELATLDDEEPNAIARVARCDAVTASLPDRLAPRLAPLIADVGGIARLARMLFDARDEETPSDDGPFDDRTLRDYRKQLEYARERVRDATNRMAPAEVDALRASAEAEPLRLIAEYEATLRAKRRAARERSATEQAGQLVPEVASVAKGDAGAWETIAKAVETMPGAFPSDFPPRWLTAAASAVVDAGMSEFLASA